MAGWAITGSRIGSDSSAPPQDGPQRQPPGHRCCTTRIPGEHPVALIRPVRRCATGCVARPDPTREAFTAARSGGPSRGPPPDGLPIVFAVAGLATLPGLTTALLAACRTAAFAAHRAVAVTLALALVALLAALAATALAALTSALTLILIS